MNTTMLSVDEIFSSYAGILFRVNGTILNQKVTLADNEKMAFFLWNLFSEAVARAESIEDNFSWINHQIQTINYLIPSFKSTIDKAISYQWAAWLPLILFSKDKERLELWNKFCLLYPEANIEEKNIRKLLFELMLRYGKNLFSFGDWIDEVQNPDRFSTPVECAIIKLGLTLKHLKNNSEDEEAKIFFDTWRKLLLDEILHKLPGKIKRGFASKWPLFQDLVLAILHGGEWLLIESQEQVIDYITNSALVLNEELTPNQIIMASALIGWNLQYNKCSNWIKDRNQRSFFSRQAIRMVIKLGYHPEIFFPGIDPIVLFSSKDGSRSRYNSPFIKIKKYVHIKSLEYDDSKIRIISKSEDRINLTFGDIFHSELVFNQDG